MIRRGELSATTKVGDVLRWAADRRESGGLFVEGPVSGAVYLVDGDISFVDAGLGMPLEQQLVASGVLTREQLPDVLAQVKAGRDLGFVLDGEPGVEYRGAVQVVHDRSVEALVHLLGAVSGHYLLDRYQQHPYGLLGHWSVEAMLGIARKKQLRGLDLKAIELLAQVPEPTEAASDAALGLPPTELQLLVAARGGRILEDLAHLNGLDLTTAAALAQDLADRGLLAFASALPEPDEAVPVPQQAPLPAPTPSPIAWAG